MSNYPLGSFKPKQPLRCNSEELEGQRKGQSHFQKHLFSFVVEKYILKIKFLAVAFLCFSLKNDNITVRLIESLSNPFFQLQIHFYD